MDMMKCWDYHRILWQSVPPGENHIDFSSSTGLK
jgi:hypothetical protein